MNRFHIMNDVNPHTFCRSLSMCFPGSKGSFSPVRSSGSGPRAATSANHDDINSMTRSTKKATSIANMASVSFPALCGLRSWFKVYKYNTHLMDVSLISHADVANRLHTKII